MTTMMVTDQELNCRLQALLDDVQKGTEIVVSRTGKPLARILPIEREKKLSILECYATKPRLRTILTRPCPKVSLRSSRAVNADIS